MKVAQKDIIYCIGKSELSPRGALLDRFLFLGSSVVVIFTRSMVINIHVTGVDYYYYYFFTVTHIRIN